MHVSGIVDVDGSFEVVLTRDGRDGGGEGEDGEDVGQLHVCGLGWWRVEEDGDIIILMLLLYWLL